VILLAGVAYWYAAHNEGITRSILLKSRSPSNRDLSGRISLLWPVVCWCRESPAKRKKTLLAARRYGEFPTLEYEDGVRPARLWILSRRGRGISQEFFGKRRVVSTKLGGRVARESKSFIELVGPERRASHICAHSR